MKASLAVRGGRPSDPLFVRMRKDLLSEMRLSDSGIRFMTVERGRQVFGKRAKRVNPHGLRHTGITLLANYCAENGIPVVEGMKVSRHKKEETFWGYVDRLGERKQELVNGISRKRRQPHRAC